MIFDSTMDSIYDHAFSTYPRESCGLLIVVRGKFVYVPCHNGAEGEDQFSISAEDYAAAEDRGEIQYVVHSHPNARPTPSEGDRVMCERSGHKWLIVSVVKDLIKNELVRGGHFEFSAEGYVAPLVGREFHHGVLDCYSIVRDWYAQEKSISLIDFIRRDDWWHKGEDLYRQNFAKAGFRELRFGEGIEVGDVILMQIKAPVPNHAGVYIGDGRMLHHLHGRMSSRDFYGGYWQQVTTAILRFGT